MAVNIVSVNGSDIVNLTDATAAASDIRSGKTAYLSTGAKASGTLSVVTYYTSTSAPTSSQGSDGDIWLKTVS